MFVKTRLKPLVTKFVQKKPLKVPWPGPCTPRGAKSVGSVMLPSPTGRKRAELAVTAAATTESRVAENFIVGN
jgi:hypothetical protein